MNRHRSTPRASSQSRATAAAWSMYEADEIPTFSRARRLRRQLLDYRSDFLLSGLLFILLIWMGLVALTLWH